MGIETVAFFAAVLLIGAGMVTAGVLAYTGRWRSWAAYTRAWEFSKTSRFGFFCLFTGGALLLVSGGGLLTTLPAPGRAIGAGIVMAGTVSGALALLSMVWLPGFLKPRWYKEWVARGARQAEVYPPAAGGHAGWTRKASRK